MSLSEASLGARNQMEEDSLTPQRSEGENPTGHIKIPITRRKFLTVAAASVGLGILNRVVDKFSGRINTAFAQVADVVKNKVENLQIIQSTIDFIDNSGEPNRWRFNNATGGIDPPNDKTRDIGTVYCYKGINNIYTKSFQPLGSLYPELQLGPGISIAIGGMAINVQLDKYYLGTDTLRNDGHYDPHLELGNGVNTPEDYTARVVIKKGLPTGGIRGINTSGYIILGNDVNGNYVKRTFNDCINPAENGTYQIRLDANGNPIGDTFVKLPDATPTPTPTPTPSPTPKPQNFKVYLPLATDNAKNP